MEGTAYLCKLNKALVDLIRITRKPAYQFMLCFCICSEIKHCQGCILKNKAKIGTYLCNGVIVVLILVLPFLALACNCLKSILFYFFLVK